MTLDIKPGIGIGSIRLGMSPSEVINAFHEGQVFEDWMGGNLNDAILFHGLRLHFDKCDGAGPLAEARLVWIVIHQREDARLFDRPMSEWTREEILQKLVSERLSLHCLESGDLEISEGLSLGFDANNCLIWLEIDAGASKAALFRCGYFRCCKRLTHVLVVIFGLLMGILIATSLIMAVDVFGKARVIIGLGLFAAGATLLSIIISFWKRSVRK